MKKERQQLLTLFSTRLAFGLTRLPVWGKANSQLMVTPNDPERRLELARTGTSTNSIYF